MNLYHDPDRALHFVSGILGLPAQDFGKCNGMIVEEDQIIAAVIYHDYHVYENGSTIQASIASIDPKWAKRSFLRYMFAYPFEEIGVNYLRVCCRRSNKKSRWFVQRLGFAYEGMARGEWDGIEDVAVYSMAPSECVWIGGEMKTKKRKKHNGQAESLSAHAA